jgi:SRSO17 transposase
MDTQAMQYLHGQLICQRQDNLMEFEKLVPDTDYQSLHHFIANSPWKEKPVLDDVAQSVKHQIGDAQHGSLHIDESGVAKQGNHSVGVGRQYCGRTTVKWASFWDTLSVPIAYCLINASIFPNLGWPILYV